MTDLSPDSASVSDPDSAAGGDQLLHRMHLTLWRYAALVGLVRAGVPEQLRGGPLTVDELAARCQADPPALARVLRAAAQTGLLRTAGPARYELTPAGTALLGSTELDRLIWNSDPEIWGALMDVGEILRTGQVPFARRHGGTYRYLAGRPETAAAFDKFMTSRSEVLAALLAETGVFPPSGTVADLGGGRGTFLAAILSAHPGLHGILLELERVTADAREYLAASGVAGRCEVVTGDFFRAVPAGADLYLLAHVIHNWDDDHAARILRTVRGAMPQSGRLLIVETPLPADDRPHIMKDLDIRLFTLDQGSRERLQAEYGALLQSTGFRLEQTIALAGQCVMVAVPAAA